MDSCKKLLSNFINEFLSYYNESLPFKIFNYIYLIATVVTISLGTYTMINGKNFDTWGWIIFTIGCLLLMFIGMIILLFCISELGRVADNSIIIETTKESNKINQSITGKSKKKILTSKRINIIEK